MNEPIEPTGGHQLYQALRLLAEQYRLRATKHRDFDAAAIYVYLEAIRVRAESGAAVNLTIALRGAG